MRRTSSDNHSASSRELQRPSLAGKRETPHQSFAWQKSVSTSSLCYKDPNKLSTISSDRTARNTLYALFNSATQSQARVFPKEKDAQQEDHNISVCPSILASTTVSEITCSIEAYDLDDSHTWDCTQDPEDLPRKLCRIREDEEKSYEYGSLAGRYNRGLDRRHSLNSVATAEILNQVDALVGQMRCRAATQFIAMPLNCN